MNKIVIIVFLSLLSCSSAQQDVTQKNILLLCIDDLRPELASFGANYIHSPNIDELAQKGSAFLNHYVNSPSCGPSRYTLLTGTYGKAGNDAIFKRAEKIIAGESSVTPSMPEYFRNHGYTTISIGKISHHPGGLGGDNLNDPNVIEMPNAWTKSIMPVAEWEHPRGAMHGLAHGEIRGARGTMNVFQAAHGSDTIYPDGHIANEAISEIEQLSKSKKPFFLAVRLIKPHLPFGAPKQYYDLYEDVEIPPIPAPEKPTHPSTWHKSGEFFQYNTWKKDPRDNKDFAQEVRKHYAACVSYADAQVGKIIQKLRKTRLHKNTIIVLWGDHGWNLGDHNIWGKHNLFEEALHSPLIILDPSMDAKKASNAIVETTDIFPTLCELSNLTIPEFANGLSLKPLMKDPSIQGHPAYSYNSKAKSIRTENYHLIQHKDDYYELYNHESDPHETNNIAESYPEIVKKLSLLIKEKALIQRKNG